MPGLAGRSPSYSARQMFDMKTGARAGVWTDLMKPVVAKLTEEDLINISAYTASLAHNRGCATDSSRFWLSCWALRPSRRAHRHGRV